MIRILLYLANMVQRSGLRVLFEGDPQFQLAGVASRLPSVGSDVAEADVLVLDEDNFSAVGLDEFLAAFTEGLPAVLVVSDNDRLVPELASLDLPGWGLLPLGAEPEELLAAGRALSEGLVVAAPGLLEPSISQLVLGTGEPAPPLLDPLTERETEVLDLLARGLPNKKIAAELFITEHTVKFHVSAICTKLGAGNRTEAVREGLRRGLVSL